MDIAVFSFIITVLSLWIAVYFGRYALHSYQESKEYMREYRGFLLNFEDTVYAISENIDQAEKSIKILLDTPRYGELTEPTAFKRYWGNLLKKAGQGLDIEITFFSDEKLIKLCALQFPNKSDEEKKKIIQEDAPLIKTLESLGVKLFRNDSIPLHIFIFDNKKAVFALQDIEEGHVISLAFVTEDRKLTDFLIRTYSGIVDEAKPHQSS